MAYQWQAKGNSSAGVEDMTLLSKVTETQIVDNLNKRYQNDLIYTYIGPVLIALNPYKTLPYFTDKETEQYHGSAAYENPPHIYALAESMFQNMLVDEENQCVIISGESGAGKTESSKLLMNYIAAVSGKGGSGVDEVKRIILGANPLLEAFGNAKTLRNNNSSRFGKYFEIKFSRGGQPIGGNISNFLLEKSRVVGQKSGERNFHIFYQLTKGATAQEKESLGTSDPAYFYYLSQSGTYEVDGIDDVQEYAEMKEAMSICGISQSDQASLLQIAAGVLHLGNIQFVEEGNFAAVQDENYLAYPAYLLGIDQGSLKAKLLSRLMTTGGRGSSVNVHLTVQQAINSRDALAKALYSRIFDWIILAINRAIQKTPTQGKEYSLGVLDIYGFEIFNKNGFEQLCINYVNEKLQQVFIELTLKSEQEEYVREGIKWTPIEFFNNKIVVELIEGKRPSGIMAVLDDVCAQLHAVTEGADAMFVQKLDHAIGQHAHYVGRGNQFVVTHYAGQVNYDSDGFCEANKDTLFRDLILLAQSTTNPFIRNLFQEDVASDDKKRPTTAGFKIRNQCNVLVETLMKCTPSYIRCIKPNEKKKPRDWDSSRVEHQVRYLNLRENINVRRAGFCYRNHFEKFLRRYMLLTPETYPHWPGNPADGVTHILRSVNMESSQWQLGRSKVFVKNPESLFMLEELRERAYHKYASRIQRCYRRWKARKYYLECKKKALHLFVGKKERRRFTLNREYIGDYLNILSAHSLRNLVGNKDKILFCQKVKKYDRRFKVQEKFLFISDYALTIVGTDKANKAKKGEAPQLVVNRKLSLGQITKVSLSTRCDDFFVLHTDSDYDNVFECGFKTELAVVLAEAYQRLNQRPLNLVFADSITYTVKKTTWESGGVRTVNFVFDAKLLLKSPQVVSTSGKVTTIGTVEGLPKESQPSVSNPSSNSAPGPPRQQQQQQQQQRQFAPPSPQFRPPPVSNGFGAQPPPAASFRPPPIPNMAPGQSGTFRPPRPPAVAANSLSQQPKFSPMGASLPDLSNSSRQPSPGIRPPPSFGRPPPSMAASIGNLSQRPPPSSLASAARSKPAPAPPKAKLDQAKALYDYQAKEADELNLTLGDIITIISRDNQGWWTGLVGGRRGLFPANYVQPL